MRAGATRRESAIASRRADRGGIDRARTHGFGGPLGGAGGPASGEPPRDRSAIASASAFARAVRAEALKSRHAAPMRLAVALALPFPLLAAYVALNVPQLGLQYTPWNYWYVLLMPISIALVASTVARLDARLRDRALLSSGMPLFLAWGAKVAWCLLLSLLSNLIVFAIFALLGLVAPQDAASVPAMLGAALSLTVASSWMVPATLFLALRFGMLAGVFLPLAVQLALSFGWSVVPFWPLFPPTATIMLPTAFLPVLPSGEPASASWEIVELASSAGDVALALAVACALTIALAVGGGIWLSRSEELR